MPCQIRAYQTRLSFRPMTHDDAQAIVQWRYPAPYDIYNLSEEAVPPLVDRHLQYYAARAKDELLGLCCFGLEARVPGGRYNSERADVLDIGLGLRPDLTGKGLGRWYVGCVLHHGWVLHQPVLFRATIAGFNRRSQRVFEQWGFKTTHFFLREGTQVSFLQMKLNAEVFLASW